MSNRRNFLKTSAAMTAASVIAAPAIAKNAKSPNERIRVGLLGMGGRMRAHVEALLELEKTHNIEIVAVCDCDQSKIDLVPKRYPALKDRKLKVYHDMRKMFEDKSIDAISNALGDRWHSLSTIWACQAGKDMYVEKPGSHNLFESRQMVAAARKYNRMVQHGTQNRSSPNIMEGIAKIKEGVIGDVYMARGLDYKIRGNLGTIKKSPVPEGLNWDKWLGPTAMQPYSQFWHKRWHFNLALASGCFANQAVHEIDILRWGLGLKEHPVFVSTIGGQYVHEDDDRTSPTHIAIQYQFKDSKPMVTYEHRSWFTNGEAGFGRKYQFVQKNFPVGTIFYGTKGYMTFPDYSSYHTFMGRDFELGPSKSAEGHPMANTPHFENWINAIRNRDHKLLNADIEEGHKSMAMCLLARTSYLVGRPVKFDPKTEQILDDKEANSMINEPAGREPYVVPKIV